LTPWLEARRYFFDMKIRYMVGTAMLIAIAATWWLSESEDEASSRPVPAWSDRDADEQSAGKVESRQPVTAQKASTAGRDVDSGTAMPAPAGNIGLSAPEAGRVDTHAATEAGAGQTAETRPSPPSAIDKSDCEAAAKTLETSSSIYDVTPSLAVLYARNPSYPNAPGSGFDQLKARLLAPLCSGTYAFNPADYVATMEFVAIGTDSHVRIQMGDAWISDGTVLSPLSESEQAYFANSGLQRRREQGIGSGRNMSRAVFERRLASNPDALIAGP
jgi:hypothetical protein